MQRVVDGIRRDVMRRPWWMTLMYVFCLYMTFVYMPFDIFLKPVANDEEVWFGVTSSRRCTGATSLRRTHHHMSVITLELLPFLRAP